MRSARSTTLRIGHARLPAQALAAALLLCVGALAAHATDTYAPLTRQLDIPALAIGSATYANVVVTVGTIVSGPSGSAPDGSVDTYDPATGQLTVPAVQVGSTTYFNAVVTVEGPVSIGGVAGADSFNGTYLKISSVEAGGKSYANVTLAVSAANLVSVGEGLPLAAGDEFDAAAGRLSIAAVQVGSRVFTNVVISANLASVVAVGPTVSLAQVQKDIFTPQCASCHYPGAYPDLPMDLSSAAASAAALVNVVSVESNALRVKPGDPNASYIIQKLQGAASIQGDRMPDGGPYLSIAQVEEVSSWILGL